MCVALFLLEATARFLPSPYRPNAGHYFECHSSLGWTGEPNFTGLLNGPGFKQNLRFNALGMHDADHSLTKEPNTFRILMLGDSFIHAVQVDESATAHQILEDYLNDSKNANQPAYEVISGGVVNWGTNQELVFYREYGREFQPDLVLLMIYLGNDLLDNLPGNVLTIKGQNCYAPYFAVCEGNLNPNPLTYAPGLSSSSEICSPARRGLINTLGSLYQHSRLYQQIEPLIIKYQPRQEFGQAYPSAFSALYVDTDEAALEQAWQVTTAIIAQLQQEVSADGVPLAVGIISPEIVIRLATLSPAEQEIFLRDNPDFATANLQRPNDRLAEFLNSRQIPFIDLTQPMIEYSTTHPNVPLYIVGEGHWTVEGNRLAAQVLYDWLRQFRENQ